jgi:hypothetical protein
VTRLGVATGIALLLWGLAVSTVFEDRLLAWHIRRCRGSGTSALLFFLGLTLAVGVLGVAMAAVIITAGGGSAAATLTYLGVAVVLAPLAALLTPADAGGALGRDLQRAGASAAVARTSALGAVLPMAVTWALLGAGYFTTVADIDA